MPAKDTTDEDEGAEASALQALLNQADGATVRPVTMESLNKMTLKQLVDGARRLGLSAVSKLKKDALVKAVLQALHAGGHVHADGHPRGDGQGAPGIAAGTDNGWTEASRARHADATEAAAADQNGAGRTDAAVAEPPLSHKFEVGQPGRASSEAMRELLRESSKAIPWGYGRDRVTAMPVDADRLFAYWEVLDDSIAVARGKLGPGGPGAWLNLRVYDTTGRIFDGTNAHGFIDHQIGRGDRQWFFAIGRPTSEAIIEIGLMSHEGYFVKIARSGRVEFPRREPAPPSEPEWLTVRVSTGQVEHPGARVAGRPARLSPAAATPGAPAGTEVLADIDASVAAAVADLQRTPWNEAVLFADGGAAERHEWEEVHADGTVEAFRRFRWDGPTTITSWEAGPFSHPVEIPEPVRETFLGKTRVLRLGERTHVLYGPWQVVIRGLGAQHARAVVSRWEVYRTWAVETGHHVDEFSVGAGRGVIGAGASGRTMGASDRRWVGGSELRLGGSSELYFLMASELRLGGASEFLFAGASQWAMRGSSERLYGGASELLRRGSSERVSGLGFLGGSEGRLGGGAGSPGAAGAASGANTAGHADERSYPQPPSPSSTPSSSPPIAEGHGNPDSKPSRGGL